MNTSVLLAVVALTMTTLSGQQPGPFTTATNLVVVPVVAVDGKGATVTGLTQSDFELFEDGKPVPIQTFLAPEGTAVTGEDGRFIVIALDNLFTSADIAFRVKDIARRFVARMQPGDVMSVLSINGGNAVTTTAKTELNAAIGRFTPFMGEGGWVGGTKAAHGLRMLSSLSDQLSKSTHRRKVLVFIGAAYMFSPNEPSAPDREKDLSPEWTEAIKATSRNNVSVYNIDPKGMSESTNPADDWSQSFATETGGYAWLRTNNYGAAVDRIWQESGSYYLLGYPAPITDQRIHKIEVKVAKRGVTIRARKARG